jgi:Holliday junction DNA helicase RuvA
MIATLSGTVSEKIADTIVLDVKGVGYGLLMPAEDFNRLLPGDPAKLYVYEHIRENSHDLFGFTHLDTKVLFEKLLEVNGVGPKMALNMLSIGSVSQVLAAIAGGDVKFLQSASGVGKRVAERVVVDLKDKVGLPSEAADALLMRPGANMQDEAVQALTALGYSNEDAAQALASVDKNLSTEERVKQALKGSSL